MYFVILPHQLFEKKYLDKKYKYIIWEHPHYFIKYKYNQKKIILHRGSMKYFYDYLKKYKYNVQYCNYDKKINIDKYAYFDPIDKVSMPKGGIMIESPNFILNKDMYNKYRSKTKSIIFNNFYMWSKRELNIMPDVKSQDKLNRNKLAKNINIPPLPNNSSDKKYMQLGITYVKKHFSNNYGNTNDFTYPLTHKTAKKWLNNFIKHRLINFGSYQDAIAKGENYLFHSVLSSSINIGLLNPYDIIQNILMCGKKIPLNSLEGFIRQLFWREYQRYCYIYVDFDKKYFDNRSKLTTKWYTGDLGIKPVDNCIKKGFNTGYLHHIERLMIVGNFMNLSNITPKEGYKWFMEFSCDSYEWVMNQNVLDMVFFVTGGLTMRRPYVSSSNYILKMSDYKKDKWCDVWDNMYYKFLKKNKKKLWKFRYYFRGVKSI